MERSRYQRFGGGAKKINREKSKHRQKAISIFGVAFFRIMKEALEHTLNSLGVSLNAKFVLAVSGGVDSMVLLHVFSSARLNFVVAHCNFGLRGKESDQDQELVIGSCEKLGVTHFVKQISLDEYKKSHGVSTQMAARDLRYRWFRELLSQEKGDYLVTAHHLNDSVETVLLNMVRGTGIEGIKGISALRNQLIRPLLAVSKREIQNYAQQNKVLFREDESNRSNKYKRNKLRNVVVPILEEINPSFMETMKNNLSHFKETFEFYQHSMNLVIESITDSKENGMSLYLEKLMQCQNPSLVLFEAVKSYGFERSQTDDVVRALSQNHFVGKEFFTLSHRLLLDRTKIFVREIEEEKNEIISVKNQNKIVTFGLKLTFKQFPVGDFDLLTDSKYAFVDAEKLVFPLKLRKWKEGDKFQPLGMFGKKKVSDFLIDKKVSKIDKEKTWVLLSEDKICWIVGHRIDDSFKLTSSTKTVLQITFDSN